MGEIWANRLIAGTKVWDDVPDHRIDTVKASLKARVGRNAISADDYKKITGEDYIAE